MSTTRQKEHHQRNPIMKKAVVVVVSLLVTVSASDEVLRMRDAQQQEIKNHRKQEQREIELRKRELLRHASQSNAAFDAWYAAQKKEFAAFKRQTAAAWGEFLAPSNTVWVEYGADTASVIAVDFEKGAARVCVLLDSGATAQCMRENVEAAVARAITSRGSTDFLPRESPPDRQRFVQPVLENQIADERGNLVTVTGVSVLAAHLVEHAATSKIDNKVKVTIRFDLAPGHLDRRAARYLPLVKKYAEKYGVAPSRVMATIHTESHFNPMAISSANAVGLMQLVPLSGGREAYEFVYNTNGIPPQEMLYDPETNIELGCAYIHLLKNNYFGAIRDTEARRYCSIAAYNTGPGNVAYAFTGKRTINEAMVRINRMESPRAVYEHLVKNLPYAETRRYLPEVTARIGRYE